jgi:hypothetical protein
VPTYPIICANVPHIWGKFVQVQRLEKVPFFGLIIEVTARYIFMHRLKMTRATSAILFLYHLYEYAKKLRIEKCAN